MAIYLSNDPTKRKLYWKWCAMRQRCRDKKTQAYRYYGARGIKVCDRWNKFDAFYKDMLPTYKKGLTIDRIDSNKDYSPDNCRWATPKEQALNTRNVARARRFLFNGMTKTIAEWAKYTGIKRRTLAMRLIAYKWPIERALTKEVGSYGR